MTLAVDSKSEKVSNLQLANSHSESYEFDFCSEKYESAFKLWSKYEDIAMHFNELIIKLRIQAIGGLTIIGTIATAAFRVNNNLDAHILKYMFLVFCLVWFAIFLLDIFYYDRLLLAAVDQLVILEERFKDIKLSTRIQEEVKNTHVIRYLFYGIVFSSLLAITIYFYLM